ncbi:MAG: acyltransferase [Thermodesulfobacteriota bacterium]
MKTSNPRNVDKPDLHRLLHDTGKSDIARYRDKVWGDVGWIQMLAGELMTGMLSGLPGGLGYFIRQRGYRCLFRHMGKGVILGRNIVLRHPGRIALGDETAIDDEALLDAAGAGDGGITIGERVIVSRNCIIQGKTAPVVIGNGADIGAYTVMTSVGGIVLEDHVLIAGNVYIGGGRYHIEDRQLPILRQGVYSMGPIRIGSGSWIGAGAIVLDGVTIGRGCVIGAGSVVTKDIPDFWIAAGVPAKPIRRRFEVQEAD